VKTIVFSASRNAVAHKPTHGFVNGRRARRFNEEKVMKRTMLAIALFTATGFACAADQSLAPVTVQDSSRTIDCTPPNDDAACAKLHAAIRSNFSSREIGMLFGSVTAYPESKTSYQRTKERYAKFLHEIDAENQSLAVAAK
jgi:hypothetical protein